MSNTQQNPLPGVPKIESPFFEAFFNDDTPDQELVDIARRLNRDGMAVIEFPDPDASDIFEEIKASLTSAFDWNAWASGGADMRVQDAWAYNTNVRRVAANEAVRNLLTNLYGREAWPFQTLNFPVGTQQHMHTDSVHFSSMPERFMCGVWVAMEDIGPDQGPLFYYPGSHRWPIYTNEHIGHRHADLLDTTQHVYEPMWRALADAHGVKPKPIPMKKGQAAIWAANLIHGGNLHNDKSLTRWSQVTHYYFEDCSYYTPMRSDLPAGLVNYRSPFNIISGKPEQNMYLGHLVDNEHIARSAPGKSKRSDFDATSYLLANKDVADAGHDAWDHYVKYGKMEDRPLKP